MKINSDTLVKYGDIYDNLGRSDLADKLDKQLVLAWNDSDYTLGSPKSSSMGCGSCGNKDHLVSEEDNLDKPEEKSKLFKNSLSMWNSLRKNFEKICEKGVENQEDLRVLKLTINNLSQLNFKINAMAKELS